MSLDQLRDRTAIVGIGTTAFGPRYRDLDPELTAYELAVEALTNALDDAGLHKDDVDGLIGTRVPSYARIAWMAQAQHVGQGSLPVSGYR